MTRGTFKKPGQLLKSDGMERRVGIEVEMSGIELLTIAEKVVEQFGGTIAKRSPYEYDVEGTAFGKFKVELDFGYLTKYGRERLSPGMDKAGELELIASDALGALAKNIVPCELVAPPIEISYLQELDGVIERLRSAGAQGTRESALFAFGVHLNPELPDLHCQTILHYLRAFLCLADWLVYKEEVVLSRKLSPFIRAFSNEYIEMVLDEAYNPKLTELIDDYLEFNPTRNRVMDMLPLFAYLDEERVVNMVGNQKLRKRPTLHYRLPNSDIDNPHWGIWKCWNDWWQVEELANDPARLRQVCEGYFYNHKLLSKEIMTPWKEKVKTWLIVPT
ncbi:hypothetical protein BTA51_24520 [Hahella sp. CCB-MM4]|uniref:amidoligase family protein n=1 Tax=Hahella sp. (strain CCB-MM4) TaxID=1926491 RepID=UPI000B9B6B09|nr:amidoligase family protein [Hahella sp. CCB-MM4]OZG70751.1 hypothetical protein BTA51_24520 [Hahella sp. CCB-MM4]